MRARTSSVGSLLLLLTLALLPACSTAQQSTPADSAASLGVADLQSLRWIAGTWRGSGDGQAPFYERYHFADDSTLVVEGFADSTLAVVTEVTRFELRGGRLANATPGDSTSKWVAARVAAGAVTFVPVRRARNRFTWRPVSQDRWVADLSWPARDTLPARARTYDMVRWSPPAR
jgi:hypothetical protein